MSLKEMGGHIAGWRIEIIATDLSNEVLEKAKAGVYSQFEVQRGLPIQLLIKYFSQVGDTWQIAPELRAMVQFGRSTCSATSPPACSTWCSAATC